MLPQSHLESPLTYGPWIFLQTNPFWLSLGTGWRCRLLPDTQADTFLLFLVKSQQMLGLEPLRGHSRVPPRTVLARFCQGHKGAPPFLQACLCPLHKRVRKKSQPFLCTQPAKPPLPVSSSHILKLLSSVDKTVKADVSVKWLVSEVTAFDHHRL